MKSQTILIVEDNIAHVRLIQEAFKESSLSQNMVSVKDGIEAMAYLRREKPYESATTPDLILLDLNLPRKDGREVLMELKSDRQLCCIPVLVLTTSNNERDIQESYRLHANCYIQKSQNLKELFQIVNSIHQFWMETVTLPLDI